MKRDTLIQAISQFALFSVALAAHDHRRGGREAWGEGGKRLAPYHFQDIPHCMVDCIYRMDRSDLPHCTPDKYYDRFDVRDFIRDPEVADCFCNDVFFLKGFSECVIDSCKKPSQFYRAGKWGWDHCKARGVNLLSPKNIPYIPRGADLFKNWEPERYAPPRFIPEPIEDRTSTTTVTSTANFTMTSTHVSTATATSVSVSVSTHFTNTQTLLSTVGGPVTLTTTVSASAPTVTTTPTARKDDMTYEVGLNSFSGPSCVKRCYEDKTKAGLFTEDKYKEDVHPKCKSIYEKYVGNSMNTTGWSEDDQRKISRCVCTHKSYVKAMSECGLKECAGNVKEAQAAVLFGYQVCSKKGMIEFPYVDIMVEKLEITIPSNLTLPDRVSLASHGVGGAPTFPILDEEGEKMMFPNAAEHITGILQGNALFVSYAIGTVLFIAFW
ncbi:uncharacterized protein LAJ45_04032 [Morchella importuna]|nr:uncharacterized protein LAJ45_04032 [Morchella importuna]KAH8152038.1 hypothetical protein LAJ45_04032 [Morchella importuna]